MSEGPNLREREVHWRLVHAEAEAGKGLTEGSPEWVKARSEARLAAWDAFCREEKERQVED
jgi:hypothetical protein